MRFYKNKQILLSIFAIQLHGNWNKCFAVKQTAKTRKLEKKSLKIMKQIKPLFNRTFLLETAEHYSYEKLDKLVNIKKYSRIYWDKTLHMCHYMNYLSTYCNSLCMQLQIKINMASYFNNLRNLLPLNDFNTLLEQYNHFFDQIQENHELILSYIEDQQENIAEKITNNDEKIEQIEGEINEIIYLFVYHHESKTDFAGLIECQNEEEIKDNIESILKTEDGLKIQKLFIKLNKKTLINQYNQYLLDFLDFLKKYILCHNQLLEQSNISQLPPHIYAISNLLANTNNNLSIMQNFYQKLLDSKEWSQTTKETIEVFKDFIEKSKALHKDCDESRIDTNYQNSLLELSTTLNEHLRTVQF